MTQNDTCFPKRKETQESSDMSRLSALPSFIPKCHATNRKLKLEGTVVVDYRTFPNYISINQKLKEINDSSFYWYIL